MALPAIPNVTCDIYRSGSSPPAAPDVAGVSAVLSSSYRRRKRAGDALSITSRFTHVLLVDVGVDVRDGWTDFTAAANGDTVYIPDKDGNSYRVIFVERARRGLATDHKRVYLHRDAPDWDDVY
jgi:hypothetical protein